MQVYSDTTVLVFSMEFHPLIVILCNFVVAISRLCGRPGTREKTVQACEPPDAVRSTIDIYCFFLDRSLNPGFYTVYNAL